MKLAETFERGFPTEATQALHRDHKDRIAKAVALLQAEGREGECAFLLDVADLDGAAVAAFLSVPAAHLKTPLVFGRVTFGRAVDALDQLREGLGAELSHIPDSHVPVIVVKQGVLITGEPLPPVRPALPPLLSSDAPPQAAGSAERETCARELEAVATGEDTLAEAERRKGDAAQEEVHRNAARVLRMAATLLRQHGASEVVKLVTCDRCPAQVPEMSVRVADWLDAHGNVHLGLVCDTCRVELERLRARRGVTP